MEHRLNELIIVLTSVSLVCWVVVGVTALMRALAQFFYQRRGRARLTQQPEETAEQ